MSIAELWSELDAWLKQHAPVIAGSLRPGASREQLDALKQSLPAVPAEVLEHLGCHDGQDPWIPMFHIPGLPTPVPPMVEEPGSDNVGFAFFSAEDIEGTCAAMAHQQKQGIHKKTKFTNSDGRVRPVFWVDQWVPVATRARADKLCLDFAPADKGTVGQLILHPFGQTEREVVGPGTFSDLLARLLSDLKAGAYRVDEFGALRPSA